MDRLETVDQVRAWGGSGPDLGFVPTMGALHAGHLALVEQAHSDSTRIGSGRVIVSIFVNPLQFGPNEDLERYPRDLEGDLRQLAEAKVDAVFFPKLDEIYPDGFATTVQVDGPLTERLEAASRPGHFAGVTTVVAKLFQIVQPARSYFGMKDAQQLLVIAKMVRDLAIPTALVPVPTVREPDGLAMSSRNAYLTPQARAAAAAIPRALDSAAELYEGGERDAGRLRQSVETALGNEPLLRPQYVSCARLDTLEEWDKVEGAALLSLAVEAGQTRLIDNRWLGLAGDRPELN
jgi:pantoate--beta-alanine ligase